MPVILHHQVRETSPTGVEQGQAQRPEATIAVGSCEIHSSQVATGTPYARRLFNLAIDSKLRGCDLVAVRVDDMAANGYAVDRATIRQRKTGRPVRFESTEVTKQAVDDYLRASGLMRANASSQGTSALIGH